jgi:hypothetical protein
MYFLKENRKNYFSMFYLTFFDRPAPNYDSDCSSYIFNRVVCVIYSLNTVHLIIIDHVVSLW